MKNTTLAVFAAFMLASHSISQQPERPEDRLSNDTSVVNGFSFSGQYPHFYAAWLEAGNVLFRRSTDGGHTWESQVTISAAGDASSDPVVAAGNTGPAVVIVWQKGTSDVFHSRSLDRGATFSTPSGIRDSGGNPQQPVVAVDSPFIHVAWRTATTGVWYDMLDLSATTPVWGTDIQLTTGSVPTGAVRIAAGTSVLGRGVAVAWREIISSGVIQVFLRTRTHSGGSWGSFTSSTGIDLVTPPNVTELGLCFSGSSAVSFDVAWRRGSSQLLHASTASSLANNSLFTASAGEGVATAPPAIVSDGSGVLIVFGHSVSTGTNVRSIRVGSPGSASTLNDSSSTANIVNNFPVASVAFAEGLAAAAWRNGGGNLYYSTSFDGGVTWRNVSGTPDPIQLNESSPFGMSNLESPQVVINNGAVLAAYRHLATGDNNLSVYSRPIVSSRLHGTGTQHSLGGGAIADLKCIGFPIVGFPTQAVVRCRLPFVPPVQGQNMNMAAVVLISFAEDTTPNPLLSGCGLVFLDSPVTGAFYPVNNAATVLDFAVPFVTAPFAGISLHYQYVVSDFETGTCLYAISNALELVATDT